MLGFVVHLCRKRPNEPQTLHCPNQMVISLKYCAMCISRTRLNTCFLLGLNHQVAFGLLGSYFSHFKRSGCSLDRLTHVGLALSLNLTRFRDILNKYSAGGRDSIPGLELRGLGYSIIAGITLAQTRNQCHTWSYENSLRRELALDKSPKSSKGLT